MRDQISSPTASDSTRTGTAGAGAAPLVPGRAAAPARSAVPGRTGLPASAGGSPLPSGLRADMERSFGAEFSAVRVHANDAGVPRGVRAFARGHDLHFAPGEYDPASPGGRELIGHELAHVAQQRDGRVAGEQGKGGVVADPALEREADALGARAARGEVVATGRGTGGSPAAAPAQCKLGFEFEMSVPLTTNDGSSPQGAPDQMDDTYEFVTSKGVAEKTPVSDNGYAGSGFKVVTDHGPISEAVDNFKKLYKDDQHVGGDIDTSMETANVEFVTAALDERADNYVDLYGVQLRAVAASMKGVMAQNPATTRFGSGNFDLGIPNDLRPPIAAPGKNVDLAQWTQRRDAMRNAVHDRLYMQATAGIDPAALPTLMNEQNTDKRFAAHDTHRMMLGLLPEMVEATKPALKTMPAPTGMGDGDFQSVLGFLYLVYEYLLGAALWQSTLSPGGTVKNMVPFFSKVNVGQVRNDLPALALQFIDTNKNALAVVMTKVQNEKILAPIAQRQLFDPTPGQAMNTTSFLLAVLAGQQEAFSEPSINATDAPVDGRKPVPLEFRTIAYHPTPDEIFPVALEFAEKVRSLNGK